MKKHFEKPLKLTGDQEVLVEMHSILNILNVLKEEVLTFGKLAQPSFDGSKEDKDLGLFLKKMGEITAHLHDRKRTLEALGLAERLSKELEDLIRGACRRDLDLEDRPEVKASMENIYSILDIYKTRARELVSRRDNPYVWIDHEIFPLKESFVTTLAAFQKNAKGRFLITDRVQSLTGASYFVDFKIISIMGRNIIHMPAVFQDCMRDLIANARKYTKVGGVIRASLVDEGKDILFEIEDNGRGVPSDEIERVVEFGYRAKNAQDVITRGGGFGLTKAYFIARKFNGTFTIESPLTTPPQGKDWPQVGEGVGGPGTKISISIPRP